MRKAYFRKFDGMEAEGVKELKVDKPESPKLVVVTYEIMDFLKLKSLLSLGSYEALVKERDSLMKGAKTEEAWNKAKPRCDEIQEQLGHIVEMEHKCPAPEVALYEPLMFTEEMGITHYQPDETHEHSLVQDCLNYLCDRIARDIQDGEINPDAMQKMMLFSGLHGRGGPTRIAMGLAGRFPGIAGKITVHTTSGGMNHENGAVEHAYGKRSDLVDAINAYIRLPYLKCVNRFEQGLRGMDELEI